MPNMGAARSGLWALTMKVFPAKISERAALQNLYDVRE